MRSGSEPKKPNRNLLPDIKPDRHGYRDCGTGAGAWFGEPGPASGDCAIFWTGGNLFYEGTMSGDSRNRTSGLKIFSRSRISCHRKRSRKESAGYFGRKKRLRQRNGPSLRLVFGWV